jgi:hypothetical protein
MKARTRRYASILAISTAALIFILIVIWMEFLRDVDWRKSDEISTFSRLPEQCADLDFTGFDEFVDPAFLDWRLDDSLSRTEATTSRSLGRTYCVFESEARIEECGELIWMDCIKTFDDSSQWPDDGPSNRIRIEIEVYESAAHASNRLVVDSPTVLERDHFTLKAVSSNDETYQIAIGYYLEDNLQIRMICRCVSSLYDDDFYSEIADNMYDLSLQIAELAR